MGHCAGVVPSALGSRRFCWRQGRCLLAAVAWLAVFGDCAAKVTRTRVRLGPPPGRRPGNSRKDWHYIGKFGFGLGSCRYQCRLREAWPQKLNGTELRLETYMDEEWALVEATEDVCERAQHSRRTLAIRTGEFGEWGEVEGGALRHTVRAHVWYFAIADCNHSLNVSTEFEVEIHATQADGSEFSVELRWALPANVVMVCSFAAFLLNFWRRTVAFQNYVGSLHAMIWAFAAILVVQFIAELMYTGHLAVYRSDGMGLRGLEFASEALFIFSQIMQTSLLIMIASGYTLTQAKLGDLDIVPLILFIVGLVNIVVAVVDKLRPEEAHVFSEYEGAKGWTLLVMHVVLYIWFLLAAHGTKKGAGLRVQNFLSKFRAAASLNFLAYPLTFFVAHLFAPYLRKPIMEAGIMFAQVCSNFWLASLFLDHRGTYFETSSLGASPLPGGTSPVRFFKDD